MLLASLSETTQNNWIFVATMITVVILVATTIIASVKWWQSRHRHPFKLFHYLIPKRGWQYFTPKLGYITFDNADNLEKQQDKLTVSIGTYNVLCIFVAKENLTIRYAYPPIFEGNKYNKPKLADTSVQSSIQIRKDDFAVINYRVKSINDWIGKAMLEFYVEDVGKVRKKLNFNVSANPDQDDIPFLKVKEDEIKTYN